MSQDPEQSYFYVVEKSVTLIIAKELGQLPEPALNHGSSLQFDQKIILNSCA